MITLKWKIGLFFPLKMITEGVHYIFMAIIHEECLCLLLLLWRYLPLSAVNTSRVLIWCGITTNQTLRVTSNLRQFSMSCGILLPTQRRTKCPSSCFIAHNMIFITCHTCCRNLLDFKRWEEMTNKIRKQNKRKLEMNFSPNFRLSCISSRLWSSSNQNGCELAF